MERYGNEAAPGLGRFGCLPEDVLMSILNRIHDLKSLFQFTLVSKGFASKTYGIKFISLKLPAFSIDSIEAPTNIFHLSPQMCCAESLTISQLNLPPSPSKELKCTKFLQKFTNLECVSFEAACPRTPCSSPSLKWKVKLGNCGSAVQMLISVLPNTLHKVTVSKSEEGRNNEDNDKDEEGKEDDDKDEYDDEDEEDDENEEEEEEDDDEEEKEDEEVGTNRESLKYPAKGCFLFSLMSFAEWFDLIFSLIKNHDALKSVICTDSGKHGKIVLNEEQVVEWRKMLLCGKLSHEPIPRNIIHGVVHSLQNKFMIMNFISSPALGRDILESMEYDQEEEAVVADVVKMILTKPHSSCMHLIRR